MDTAVSSNDVRSSARSDMLSSDLTMDKHVSNVCSAGFYRLRQLRRVRRSLDSEPAATLVHAFVTSRIDYTVMYCWRAQRRLRMISCSVCWMRQHVLLSPVYSDRTQLNSTQRRVELSWVELRRFGHPLRRTTPIADGRWAARSQSVLSRSVRCL